MSDFAQFVNKAREESEQARNTRMHMNHQNRSAFMGHQDWSSKIKGQSTEFIPKTSTSLEQLVAFIKRSMVTFGNWFSTTVPDDSPVEGNDVTRLLNCYLDSLPEQGQQTSAFSTRLGDAIKSGALESLVILKCTGQFMPARRVEVDEDGTTRVVADEEKATWKPDIQVVRSEDYYPDPTGRGLYEIHRTERDLHEIIAKSKGENPIYDPSEVEKLIGTMTDRDEDEERSESERGQDETREEFRHTVIVDEFWGTTINEDGTVDQTNVVGAVANEDVIIRPPEPNPWWHGESPFVSAPLQRVPHSVWHKALYDDAVGLNFAMNELFNLMLDGGIASVWGIRQVRPHLLANPGEISEGIPQGATLVMREDAPEGVGAVENVENPGQVPQDAMLMFQTLDREFNAAALTSEIKMGALPQRQVKATEVVESLQSQATVLDAMTRDLETGPISDALRKTWLNMIQHFEDLDAATVIDRLGANKTLALRNMEPQERYNLFFVSCVFDVHGLSETMARSRDFQKMMAILQATGSNPLLMRAFMRAKFSGQKMLETVFRTLNFDPERFRDTENAEGTPEAQAAEVERLAAAIGGGNGASLTGENIGEGGLASDISQNADPSMVGESGNQ